MADINAEFEIIDEAVEVARLKKDVIPGQKFQDIEQVIEAMPMTFDDPALVTSNTTEIEIKSKFVPGYVATNIHQIQAFAALKRQEIEAIDVTTADVPTLEQNRKAARKVLEKINRTRIDFKKLYMAPFEEKIAEPLNAEYKNLEEALAPLDGKITAAENARIANKKKDIDAIIATRLAKEDEEIDKFLHSCSWLTYIENPGWLNKAPILPKIEKEIDAMVTQAVSEIKALGLFSSENIHASEMLDDYRTTGNLAHALNLKEKLEKKRLEYIQLEEERKAREKAARMERERQEAERKVQREAAIARAAEEARRKAEEEALAQAAAHERGGGWGVAVDSGVGSLVSDSVTAVEPQEDAPITVQGEWQKEEIHQDKEPESVIDLPPVQEEETVEMRLLFPAITGQDGRKLLDYLMENKIRYRVIH